MIHVPALLVIRLNGGIIAKHVFSQKRSIQIYNYIKTALGTLGIKYTPKRFMQYNTATKKYESIIDIVTTPAQARRVKDIILAGMATIGITGIPKRKPKTVKKSKYKLTKKQNAELKKTGYVFITRNKKRIKVKK